MDRTLFLICTLIVTSTACAIDQGADDSVAAAAAILVEVTATTQDDLLATSPVDVSIGECAIAVEVDEYGFQAEVRRCDGDLDTEDILVQTADSLEGWLGSANARKLASRLQAALILQRSCVDPTVLQAARTLAAEAPEQVQPPLQRAIAALQRSARDCNGDLVGWQDHLETALDELQRFIALVSGAVDE